MCIDGGNIGRIVEKGNTNTGIEPALVKQNYFPKGN